VQSERHCTAPAGSAPIARPGGTNGPTAVLEVTSTGVRGIADLGGAGQYQDEYVKTPKGWRFRCDFCVADQNGVKRLRTSGVAIGVSAGAVTGRAYLKDGGYYDDVYERIGPQQWRIKSRAQVSR